MRNTYTEIGAHSLNNGIAFYSNVNEEFASVIRINNDNKISTEWKPVLTLVQNSIKSYRFAILIFIIMTIINFLLLEWLEKQSIISSIQNFLLLIGISIVTLFIITTIFDKIKNPNLYKYHAAEHMVINAFYDLHRVPTLEEIKNYSRYSNSCGGNTISQLIFLCTALIISSCFENPYIIGAISLFGLILPVILTNLGLFNFIQFFTTQKPTDKELNIAINGLTYWLDNEEKFDDTEESNVE